MNEWTQERRNDGKKRTTHLINRSFFATNLLHFSIDKRRFFFSQISTNARTAAPPVTNMPIVRTPKAATRANAETDTAETERLARVGRLIGNARVVKPPLIPVLARHSVRDGRDRAAIVVRPRNEGRPKLTFLIVSYSRVMFSYFPNVIIWNVILITFSKHWTKTQLWMTIYSGGILLKALS